MLGFEVRRRPEPDVWKGLAAGLVGGLVATAVMTMFQNAWKEIEKTMTGMNGDAGGDSNGGSKGTGGKASGQGIEAKNADAGSTAKSDTSKRKSSGNQKAQSSSAEGGQEEGGGNVTEVVASEIAKGVFDHRLAKEEKELAGKAVHYGFGTVIGGAYGMAAELLPPVTTGAGSLYGAGVWLGADETVLPVLGLAKMPTEYPISTHAYGLASHLVYGVTAEVVRRMVRHVL